MPSLALGLSGETDRTNSKTFCASSSWQEATPARQSGSQFADTLRPTCDSLRRRQESCLCCGYAAARRCTHPWDCIVFRQHLLAGGFKRPPLLRHEEHQGQSDLGLDGLRLGRDGVSIVRLGRRKVTGKVRPASPCATGEAGRTRASLRISRGCPGAGMVAARLGLVGGAVESWNLGMKARWCPAATPRTIENDRLAMCFIMVRFLHQVQFRLEPKAISTPRWRSVLSRRRHRLSDVPARLGQQPHGRAKAQNEMVVHLGSVTRQSSTARRVPG